MKLKYSLTYEYEGNRFIRICDSRDEANETALAKIHDGVDRIQIWQEVGDMNWQWIDTKHWDDDDR